MADVELRLTADTGGAEKGISGFRKEYQALVKAIEKPMRQIDALQKTQETAKQAGAEFFAAKNKVKELKTAIAAAGQPVKSLDRDLVRAERTLSSATRAFELQKTRVREQRAELKAAGVDYRNLAAEQQRLQGALSGAMGKGQADATIGRAMDSFGVSKLRELRAQLVSLRSDYARLSQSGQLSATERIAAETNYQVALRRTQQQIAALGSGQGEGGGGVAAITARIAAITAAAYTVQRVAGFYFNAADAVGELEDRMRNALPVQEDYERSQARLEDISRRVRIPIEQTSQLFLRSVGPMQEMGFSVAQTTDLVGALSAGLVANSVKGEQAAAVINQFTKGLQTGVIRGDSFNAILENSTALTKALMEGLGVTRAELIRMANAGELTSEKVIPALSGQADALLKLADAMRVTAGDASGTFNASITKLIGAIDKLTGFSSKAVAELDKMSDAISDLADGKIDKAMERLGRFGVVAGKALAPLLPGVGAGAELADAYLQHSDSAVGALEDLTEAEELARSESERLNEQKLAQQRAFAQRYNESIQNDLVKPFKTALDDQIAAQNKANSKFRKAQEEQLATQKRYKDALEKLRVGATGPASYGNASDLKVAANQALVSGDFQRAKKYAQDSLDMLMELADAGESTWGFAGLIKGLEAIESKADSALVKSADDLRKKEIDKVRDMKKEFEELKNFKISPTIDDEALSKAEAKLKGWADMMGGVFKFQPGIEGTNAPAGWHAPLVQQPPGKSSATGAPAPRGKAQVSEPVKAVIEPVAIQQPKTPTLVALEVPASPNWIREGNSFRQKPLPVDAEPRWVHDGNSFTQEGLEVEAKPKWIRDGNSFTQAPLDVEAVVTKIAGPAGELPTVPVHLKPMPVEDEVAAVEVKSAIDEESKASVAQQFGAFIQELAKGAVIPLRTAFVDPAVADQSPPPGLATGGILRGPGTGRSDSILARLSNGEGVLNARAVGHYGENLVHRINRLQLPKFADGGVIGARNLPTIPPISPALLAQGDPLAGLADWGYATIGTPAGDTEVLMRRDSFDKLIARAALKVGRP